MRIGIGSYAYTWAIGVPGYLPARPMTAFDLMNRAAALGVAVVQLCDNLPVHDLSDSELDLLAAQAGQRGLALQVGTRGSQPAHLQKCLRVAHRLGSPLLRIVVDSKGDEPSPEEVVARLRAVQGEARRLGLRLAIENHDRFACAALGRIASAVGPADVGICLDTVNSFGALEGPEAVLEALLPYTINLHVKDFVIRRHTHQMGFEIEGAPAGEGRLDIPDLLRRVARLSYPVDAILEQWTPPTPDLDATLAREAAWAERSVAYLKATVSDIGREGGTG